MRQEDNKHKQHYEAVNLDIPDKELEAKIDAMLDPKLPDEPEEQPVVRISDTPQVVEEAPPLDIFQGAKSSPALASAQGDVPKGDHAQPLAEGSKESPQTEQKEKDIRRKKATHDKKLQPLSQQTTSEAQVLPAPTMVKTPRSRRAHVLTIIFAVIGAVFLLAASVLVWPDSRDYVLDLLNR